MSPCEDAPVLTPDLCVIGAGSGGLSVAAGAAQMGASVALVERADMGGECLNSGCVPSKALIAAAKAAHAQSAGAAFGVKPVAPEIDFKAVRRHVHDVIAAIAPHDSQARFEGLGCTVVREAATFLDRRTAAAGGRRIRARRFVIAAGSSPATPPVAGLSEVPYLTNETVFTLDALPARLLVIGGGPIGAELAQAFRRLGSQVVIAAAPALMPMDDPELVEVARAALLNDGVEIREGAFVAAAQGVAGDVRVRLDDGSEHTGSHILLAAGRRPNTDGLNLEAAGVVHTPAGIAVDGRMRSSNPRIFAIGDVVDGPRFTHVAGHQASVVVKNALFRLPAKAETVSIPHVTYTDPEVAWVGLGEAQARARGFEVRVLRARLADNDRARAERRTDGLLKAVTTRRGVVLGAGVVGPHAGDLLAPWTLAVSGKLTIRDLAETIAPYPTLSELTKRAAGSFYAASLFSARTKRVVRALLKLP